MAYMLTKLLLIQTPTGAQSSADDKTSLQYFAKYEPHTVPLQGGMFGFLDIHLTVGAMLWSVGDCLLQIKYTCVMGSSNEKLRITLKARRAKRTWGIAVMRFVIMYLSKWFKEQSRLVDRFAIYNCLHLTNCDCRVRQYISVLNSYTYQTMSRVIQFKIKWRVSFLVIRNFFLISTTNIKFSSRWRNNSCNGVFQNKEEHCIGVTYYTLKCIEKRTRVYIIILYRNCCVFTLNKPAG